MTWTSLVIPLVVCLIFAYALCKKVDIFSVFTIGAKQGAQTTFDIFPSLIFLVVCIGMIKSSGLLDFICYLISPIANAFNIPTEVVPLSIIRPISGSGALAIFEQTLKDYGADSTIGRIASVMQGSTETTFYTIAVYFGACKIKNTRHTLWCALFADFVGFVMSVISVSITFKT
ncbi:MAG: spore maturation protein [Oscillospiraceae bacterium]|nr:spore maturation protein [Oscillospiraceae bacterium]